MFLPRLGQACLADSVPLSMSGTRLVCSESLAEEEEASCRPQYLRVAEGGDCDFGAACAVRWVPVTDGSGSLLQWLQTRKEMGKAAQSVKPWP